MAEESRIYNRIVTMNANGFAGKVPISFVGEVSKMDGVVGGHTIQLVRRKIPR